MAVTALYKLLYSLVLVCKEENGILVSIICLIVCMINTYIIHNVYNKDYKFVKYTYVQCIFMYAKERYSIRNQCNKYRTHGPWPYFSIIENGIKTAKNLFL